MDTEQESRNTVESVTPKSELILLTIEALPVHTKPK